MERQDNAGLLGKVSALRQMIAGEIHTEREHQRELWGGGARGWLTLSILAASIVFNIMFLFEDTWYPIYFIIASFFILMFYFITLIIPFGILRQKGGFSKPEIGKLFANLQNQGIIKSAERFSRIFLNAFFINCRPLFAGFALLFAIDILFVMWKQSDNSLPGPTATIVLFQAITIIVFYFLVWKWQQYSMDFFSDVKDMRQRLITRQIPAWIVTLVLWVSVGLAFCGVFYSIILLPGVTVSSVISISSLEQLSNRFIAIGLILVSQYFIFRYIHGITSRKMIASFSESKARSLARQENTAEKICRAEQGLAPGTDIVCETTTLLLESKIYQIEKKTIAGAFPVYIVNPDLSVVLDPQALDSIVPR
ncbi:MAG: hypothetical protein ABFC71_01900 [Methanoregula sp.]